MGFLLFLLCMSRKKRQYNIMVKQPKEKEVWDCSNPSVKDGSMCCDGDCSMCGYKYVAERIKVYK